MGRRGGVSVPVITTLDSRALDTLKKKLATAKKEVNQFSKLGERLNKVVTGAGVLSAAGAFGVLAEKGSEVFKTQRKTELIIKNLGLASSVSAKQIEELSASLSNNTGQSMENVHAASNVFLSFSNLVKPGEDAAATIKDLTITAVDLAAKMNTDAPSAAGVLARALNNPKRAAMALAKAQVPLSDATKKQVDSLVKEGKLQQARGMILTEVQKKVKGFAAATASPFEKFQAQLNNVQATIGLSLLPVFAKLLPALLPVIQVFGQLAAELLVALLPVLQPLVDGFTAVAGWMQTNAGLVKDLAKWVGIIAVLFIAAGKATAIYRGIMQAYAFATYSSTAATEGLTFAQYLQARATAVVTGVQKGLNAAFRANPIGFIITAVTVLAGAFTLLFQHCKPFRDFLAKAMPVLGKVFGGVVAGILHGIAYMIRAFGNFANFWYKFGANIVHVAGLAFGWIPGLGDKIKNSEKGFRSFGQSVADSMNAAATNVDNFANKVDTGIKGQSEKIAASIKNYNAKTKKASKDAGIDSGKNWLKGFGDGSSGMAGNKTKTLTPKLAKVGSPTSGTAGSFTVSGSGGGLALSVTINGTVIQEKDVARSIRDELKLLGQRRGVNVALGV